MDFITIDVETANADMSSICQVGIAVFKNNTLHSEFVSLVDPQDEFDFINIEIHGIEPEDVEFAPTFAELYNDIRGLLNGQIVACHTHFDRTSVTKACSKAGVPAPDCRWLDTARVVRRAWEQFAWSGYGLSNVCKHIGFRFQHHDALEDAKACGAVLIAASDATGLSLDEWFSRVNKPIDPTSLSTGAAINRDGNPNGILFGESVTFTGALEITRAEAADLAALAGCSVGQGVTKKTTLLVVGDQDISKLAGKKKSSKHLKAEKLIAAGQSIRIVGESDFKSMVENT